MTKEQDIKALAIEKIRKLLRESDCYNTGGKCDHPDMDCPLCEANRLFNVGYRLPVKHTVISDEDIRKAIDASFKCENKQSAVAFNMFSRDKIIAQAQVDKDNKEHE
jgi:hypothetical protein